MRINWDRINLIFEIICKAIAFIVVIGLFIGMILVCAFGGMFMTH